MRAPNSRRSTMSATTKRTAVARKPRILPGTDFADMSTVSRKQWLVHHLLAVGELSVFYGEPGSGKSVLAQDIGLHVAAGRTGSAAR